ncbi:cyanophycinase [Bacillus sp. RAR_GA_16]|uniref:cyanophycinase n=1 Tax=Bacillus sp. RAR_GA_16 TaxID=2876774 RepID=UPI001CCA9ABA|nr:cyanophycinase [Bacillus sp. RAR_GA_16]MCA0173123.1 cyanophycinase [Bacillus sp. RAR_GA_16]
MVSNTTNKELIQMLIPSITAICQLERNLHNSLTMMMKGVEMMGKWKSALGLFTVLLLGTVLITQEMDVETNAADKQEKGSLVIVGGALSPDNAEVYDAFLSLAMDYRNKPKEEVKIGIMPTASATPVQSATSYKEDFIRYGADEENIEILPIAVSDDPSTEEDEAKWKDGANDEKLAEQVKKYDAIWFVGGNQLDYTDTLLANGKDTPVLASIRENYSNGAVLGGSSAGAAVMSDPMIGAGTSIGALNQGVTNEDNYGDAEDNRVFLTDGLGFFEAGMVDQHFVKRGRFGRLIVGAWDAGNEMGYGIDENSAMIVHNDNQSIEVIGESGLVIVDLSNAKKTKEYPTAMKDVTISYIEKGDLYFWDSKTYQITEDKPLIEQPYYPESTTNTGVFGEDALKQVLTYDLVDSDSDEAVGLAYELTDEKKGEGFKLVFSEVDQTRGYWGKIDGVESYAAINVSLDIIPMEIKLKVDKVNEKKMEKF